ncbi:MAG: BrnA antitoxin family protein [Bryobacteraceae bacterium]|nr:BrnA antitoxin family protein [Bryobacteraceae bacterium]
MRVRYEWSEQKNRLNQKKHGISFEIAALVLEDENCWKQAAADDSDIDYSDIPKLTEKQLAEMVRLRDIRPKVPVSVRLDPTVLEWLRSKGSGHLTRINDILRNVMEAEQRIARR